MIVQSEINLVEPNKLTIFTMLVDSLIKFILFCSESDYLHHPSDKLVLQKWLYLISSIVLY